MQVNPRAWKRAGLVWFVALVMFVVPHRGLATYSNTIFHQPAFLLIAPILLAVLSLFVPVKDSLDGEDAAVSGSYRPRRSRLNTWKGIICSVILALFVVFVLLAANADVTPQNADFTHRLNNAGGVALAGFVGLTIYFARDFKQPR